MRCKVIYKWRWPMLKLALGEKAFSTSSLQHFAVHLQILLFEREVLLKLRIEEGKSESEKVVALMTPMDTAGCKRSPT